MSGRDVLITGPSDGSYKIGKPYQIQGSWYYPAEDWSYAEEGVASWYGPGFNRKKNRQWRDLRPVEIIGGASDFAHALFRAGHQFG